MVLIDTEFQNLALLTNPSLAGDLSKYNHDNAVKAEADAKAAVDAAKVAATNAKNPEDRLDALLKEYALMNSSVDKDAVNKQVADLKATIEKRNAEEARIKKLQETKPFMYNQDVRYKAGLVTPFIHVYDGL